MDHNAEDNNNATVVESGPIKTTTSNVSEEKETKAVVKDSAATASPSCSSQSSIAEEEEDDDDESEESQEYEEQGQRRRKHRGGQYDVSSSEESAFEPSMAEPSSTTTTTTSTTVVRMLTKTSDETTLAPVAALQFSTDKAKTRVHGGSHDSSASSPSWNTVKFMKAWQTWMKLSMTLEGRDKMTKLIQYSARFLAWWLASSRGSLVAALASGGSSNKALVVQNMIHRLVLRLNALKESLATSRKAFRLGRSFTECEKLYQLGLVQSLADHFYRDFQLQRCLKQQGTHDDGDHPRPDCSRQPLQTWSLCKLMASAVKIMGLTGFFLADNIAFLTSAGALDSFQPSNHGDDSGRRLALRNQLKTRVGGLANRSYFVGAIAGLLVSLQSYIEFQRTTTHLCKERQTNEDEESECEQDLVVTKERERIRKQRMLLLVTMLKSCCDVLVFSNNPGVDLWKKWNGQKLNEGIHSVGGLCSTLCVLYTKWPSATA